MKPINKYLSTSPNKIKHIDMFPKNLDKQTLQEYFKNNKFEYIDTNDYSDFYDVYVKVDNHKNRIYTMGEFDIYNQFTWWFAFHFGGKICKNNPLFYCRLNDISKIQFVTMSKEPRLTAFTKNDFDEKFDTFKEFSEYVDYFIKKNNY